MVKRYFYDIKPSTPVLFCKKAYIQPGESCLETLLMESFVSKACLKALWCHLWLCTLPKTLVGISSVTFMICSSAQKTIVLGRNHSRLHVLLDNYSKGTSRQRSGKGAIRKRFPLQKPRWEKTKLTIRYLYHETYRKPNEQLFPNRWPLSYLNLTKNMETYIRRQQHKKFLYTKT